MWVTYVHNFIFTIKITSCRFCIMEEASYLAAKNARARRILLQKHKQLKRLKTTSQFPTAMTFNTTTQSSHFPTTMDHTMLTSTSNCLRRPFTDITPSISNQTIIDSCCCGRKATKCKAWKFTTSAKLSWISRDSEHQITLSTTTLVQQYNLHNYFTSYFYSYYKSGF